MVRELGCSILVRGLSQLWQCESSGCSESSADLLGRYGTLLFAERWKTEFGAILSSRCAALLDAFVSHVALQCAAAALCSAALQLRSRAGFVARRHGKAFSDRSPQDENKRQPPREERLAKTRLQHLQIRSAASETTAIRSRRSP